MQKCSSLIRVERGAGFLVVLSGIATIISLLFLGCVYAQPPGLRIQNRSLYYGNRPAYLYGQGFWHAVVKGGFDFNAEADWYVPYGANFTRVKTITTRIIKSTQYRPENPWYLRNDGKYDLNQFNSTFWTRLDQFLKKNEATGRIVLLQIFDEVTMKAGKDAWDNHPLCPANNINNLTQLPGKGYRGFPEVYDTKNTQLMDYYQRYIAKLLESTYKYGNIIYEVCNEYSGTKEFLAYVLDLIQTFEKLKSVDLLVTSMSCTQKLWDFENQSSAVDLLDFWHAPRSIATLKVDELYNYVTSLRSQTVKPLFTGRIGLKPDTEKSSPNYRFVARSQLWAILMAGGVAATTKEDDDGIENGPPVYNIDDKWEAEGFLGMHLMLDNLWHSGPLIPMNDMIGSRPFTENWAATVGHEVIVYMLGPGGGSLKIQNLPDGIYTAKLFSPDPCQVTRVLRIPVTNGQTTLKIEAVGDDDRVVWLTPEPFDVTARWEEQNGLYRSVIEVRDISAFNVNIILNGKDVSNTILPLYQPGPQPAGGILVSTPWINFPKGVFELEVWVHGPALSDRSISRLRVP